MMNDSKLARQNTVQGFATLHLKKQNVHNRTTHFKLRIRSLLSARSYLTLPWSLVSEINRRITRSIHSSTTAQPTYIMWKALNLSDR